MPDVRIVLTIPEKKEWDHTKIDIGKASDGSLMYLIKFYNNNKGRRLI